MFFGFIREKDGDGTYRLVRSRQSVYWIARDFSLKLGVRHEVAVEVAVDDERLDLNAVVGVIAKYRGDDGVYRMPGDAVARHLLIEACQPYRLPGPAKSHWEDERVMTAEQFITQVGSKREAAKALGVGYLTLINAKGTEIVFDGRMHRPSKLKAPAGD